MKHSRRISSQEVGTQQHKKLEKWVHDTPLDSVPRNCYGMSAKTHICKLLGISPSTIGTNKFIHQTFDKLDEELSNRGNKKARETPLVENRVSPEKLNVPLLFDEMDRLKSEVARLRYLTHTGQWIEE